MTPQSDSARVPSSVDSLPRSRITPAQSDLEAPVEYSARYIDSDLKNSVITLIGEAEVTYQKITIKAGKITIKQNENLLVAEALPDTLSASSDSTDGINDLAADSLEITQTGFPVFSDGQETMSGERMEYNFKSDRGRILRGRTEFDKGYYGGSVVKRVDPKVFNVRNGVYTTCSKAEPHYHFRGQKMKVILNDKVIAKPVVFFIGEIPLAIAPFAMFPTKESGRQSGIILPQFGSSPVEGRYLRNLGYYWATNDYFDVAFTADLFERTGFLFRTHMNYAWRYHLRGNIETSFTRKDFPGGRSERDWSLNLSHNQTIDQTTTLTVSGRFVSNNDFYKNFSDEREQRLSRQLNSNATLRKNWPDAGRSLTLNLSQTKDLETGSSFITLPRIQFTQNQRALIPFQKDERSRTGQQPRWYNNLRYSYNSLLLNSVNKDSTNDEDEDIQRRIEHSLSFSFTHPDKLFGALSLSHSLSYDEDWFDRTTTFTLVDSTNQFESSDDTGFAARRTFSYSSRASTNLYGTFYPGIGSLTAFRHKMSPSLSFSYQPDFSDPFWGYYQIETDTAGVERRLDRFGSTPRGEQMRLNYSVNNLFQMKLGEGEEQKKIDLFNLDFRGGYNFAADSLKFSDLSTTFRANPLNNLGITARMTHSFYEFDDDAARTIDRLLLNDKGVLDALRLTRLQLDLRWSLSGSRPTTPADDRVQDGFVEQLGGELGQGRTSAGFGPRSAFSAFDIPWSATLAFSYSLNKFNPNNPSKSAYVDLSNVQLQLTRNWRIGYRLRYDIVNKDIVDQRFSFYRDLHCWEAEFNWSPTGIGQGYYFRIGIKAPHLRDVKLEHRGGSTTVFRPF